MVHSLVSRLRRGEDGFTLVEQLVVMIGLTVIVAAILGVMDVASKVTPSDTERAHQVREAQVGMDRMVRELRQSYAITVSGAGNIVEADVATRNRDYRVRYDCSGVSPRRCVRTEPGGGAAVQDVINHVSNPSDRPVFTAAQRDGTSGTTYVRAAVEVRASGSRKTGAHSHRVVLEDGFFLRNRDATLG